MKKHKAGLSGRQGFTLIELLVVIAIISLLSSVVLVSMSGSRTSARDAVRQQDMQAIHTALEMYYQENGYYPVSEEALLDIEQLGIDAGLDFCYSGHSGSWLDLELEISKYLPNLPVDSINDTPGDPAVIYFYVYVYPREEEPQYYILYFNLEGLESDECAIGVFADSFNSCVLSLENTLTE